MCMCTWMYVMYVVLGNRGDDAWKEGVSDSGVLT